MGLNKSINAFLGQTYLILNGSITAGPDLKARLDEIGFTAPALTVAHTLYVAAGGQVITAFTEHGEQLKATLDLAGVRNTLDHQYSTLAQISKTVFMDQPAVLAALDLQTHYVAAPAPGDPNATVMKAARPSETQVEAVGRAKQLYDGLLAQPALIAQLTPVGYTADRLQQERAVVTALENADVAQEREKGEATGAKAQQKAALAQLKAWVRRFTGIVVPALSDRPDLLAMLGLKPRGGKR
jgi:hypothetical protein